MATEVRGGCHAPHRHFDADRLVLGASLANLSCRTSPGFLSKALYGEKNDGMRFRPGTIILAVPGHNPLPTVKGDDVMLCSTVIDWIMDCDDVMF